MSGETGGDATEDADLAILLAAALHAVSGRLLGAIERADVDGMRRPYGFVIRAVDAESPSVNRLAELLGVTKQAASRVAEEMQQAGFLTREADPQDRRVRRLRLTDKGRLVRSAALQESATIERELRTTLGATGLGQTRQALIQLIAEAGGLDDVAARRARPVW